MEDSTNRTWLTKIEAATFIGDNSSFYLDKWQTHSGSKLKGWNWVSFFFGIQWMIYRKMYAEAIVYFLFTVVVSIFISMTLKLNFDETYGTILRTILQIPVAVFGNALYRNKALRILRKTIHLSEPERLAVLQTKGGVSIVATVISALLQIAIGVFLGFLLAFLSGF